MKRLSIILAAAFLASCSPGFAAKSFNYKRPDGFAFTITPDGLTNIRLGGRVIAEGDWTLKRDKPMTTVIIRTDGNANGTTKSMRVLGPNEVKVHQVSDDFDSVFLYTFKGEDLVIKTRVTNRQRAESLDVAHFGSLDFHFDRIPDGLMLHGAESKDNTGGTPWCMHPGHMDKIGGSYATDGVFGLGLTPVKTGFTRSQLFWVGDDKLSYGATGWKLPMQSMYWKKDVPDASKTMAFHYYAEKPIPPGGAETFYLKMRLSKNQDWRHLLQSYKEHFLATYGPVRYHSDHRFYTMGALSDRTWRGEGNSWGFQSSRRIDLADGAKKYADEQIAKLTKAGGQGTILWAYQGYEPRGAQYRTDFDIIPPDVQKNFPLMRSIYDRAHMRFGLTSRPGQVTYRKDWSEDDVISINPKDPQYLNSYVRRFKNAIGMGATAFYLDSFGDSLEDVKMIKYYRAKLGPDIRTFAEQHCDAILPYTGIYTEISYIGDKEPGQDYKIAWLDTKFVDIARWMLGDMDSVVVVRLEGPAGSEPPYQWLYRHHLSPLCPDWNLGMKEEDLAALQGNYVDKNGKWRK